MLRKSNFIPFLPLFCFLFFFQKTQGQEAPKRELRAAWIATVANIDWPSKPGLSSEEQKTEYIKLLDELERVKMNAVVVQVRPAADAFYSSSLEPWSYWLTGTQGISPSPFYDPLLFMIEEAHKRGMEFHAWLNPYRAVFDVKKEAQLAKTSPVRTHPEWFVQYGTKKYFNPALPEVRTFFVKVVKDIVKRYDIDAIHFDDYFYPYRIAGKEFPDLAEYKKFGEGLRRADWRRENVNLIIKALSDTIKATKPWVKFGISPFGVWRNIDKDPTGSDTRAGQTNYDDLYADVLLWLREGWIDYVTPQIYWQFDLKAAPYGTVLDWWAKHTYGRQLYVGQALYRIGNKGSWSNPEEMPRQIRANRSYETVEGSMYFSAIKFFNNPLGINDSLINTYYRYPALPPRMPWIDSIAPSAPALEEVLKTEEGNILHWRDEDTSSQTRQFVVYRFPEGAVSDRENPKYILTVLNKTVSDNPRYLETYLDKTADGSEKYTYQVTALDRLYNESGVAKSSSTSGAKTPKALYRKP